MIFVTPKGQRRLNQLRYAVGLQGDELADLLVLRSAEDFQPLEDEQGLLDAVDDMYTVPLEVQDQIDMSPNTWKRAIRRLFEADLLEKG